MAMTTKRMALNNKVTELPLSPLSLLFSFSFSFSSPLFVVLRHEVEHVSEASEFPSESLQTSQSPVAEL